MSRDKQNYAKIAAALRNPNFPLPATMQHTCDICGEDVTAVDTEVEFAGKPVRILNPPAIKNKIIDGKTKQGPWGWMCIPCWRTYGVGLGTGLGQMFDVTTGQKLEG